MIKSYTKNIDGTDYVVGDMHGKFSKLKAHLDNIGFNPLIGDRLFSVGDLIDKGDECEKVLEWLDYDWFYPVLGNHDDYVCRFDTCDNDNWMINGGGWFMTLSNSDKLKYQKQFKELPLAIEVETTKGRIGILHANCPYDDWDVFKINVDNPISSKYLKSIRDTCIWDRSRIENSQFIQTTVKNIDAIIVGHTPLEKPTWVGNVLHIDTAGWHRNGYGFSVLKLEEIHA